MKDDRENRIKVESFQNEQCKKASVQINGYWPGLQVGRLTTNAKDLQLLPLPHKVKAMRFEELDQSDNTCLTLHRRKSALEKLKLTSLEDIHIRHIRLQTKICCLGTNLISFSNQVSTCSREKSVSR